MRDREIRIMSVWVAYDTVEIPDGLTKEEALAQVPDLPEWLAEQIDANGADLTDWEASC